MEESRGTIDIEKWFMTGGVEPICCTEVIHHVHLFGILRWI